MNDNKSQISQAKKSDAISNEYKALMRAAENAKKLAEQLGTPYVVYTPENKSADKSENANEGK